MSTKRYAQGIRPGNRFHHLTVVKKLSENTYQFQCECGKLIVGAWKSYASCGQCDFDSREHKQAYAIVIRNHADQPEFWISRLFTELKASAQNRAITFSVTREQFVAIASKPCFYCGSPASTTRTRANIFIQVSLNGLDRLDSSKGYSAENCVASCRTCNLGKSDRSVNEFLAWVKKVYEHKQLTKAVL